MTQKTERPFLIGIVGESGAGKSTLAGGLADVLGRERTAILSMDDYLRFSRKQRVGLDLTPNDPISNYMDILEQHVQLLKNGQPILKPVYNHQGGVLEPPEYFAPKPFVILEGLLGYTTPSLRDAYDVKIYVDPQESLRLKWKFQRDTRFGGYTEEQLRAMLPRLSRDGALYITPQRVYADLVLNFFPPADWLNVTDDQLNARHILRPTLPYVDLAPVLETGVDNGFELELARDADGRPADALHISGQIPDDAAGEMADLFWSLMSANAAKPPWRSLGIYRDAEGEARHSHPLGLSQLLITHYVLTAAPHHHAI